MPKIKQDPSTDNKNTWGIKYESKREERLKWRTSTDNKNRITGYEVEHKVERKVSLTGNRGKAFRLIISFLKKLWPF